MQRPLAITWSLSEVHGWGFVGVHTCLYLLDIGKPPLLLEQSAMSTLRPQNRERLSVLMPNYEKIRAVVAGNPGKVIFLQEYDVLHALSNGFVASEASKTFRGQRNVGVIAYEDTKFTPDVVERAKAWDAMVVHSTFNKRLLDDIGVKNVGLAFQGIDPTEMYPGEATGMFGDRFVIFSGGKLEFRKGQDIVLAAFKRFHQRHPDALLATAWHNVWPQTAMSMAESTLAPVAPQVDAATNKLKITEWAVANGVPADAFRDLGFLGRNQIAPLMWNCDLAVFPNRCEGATNLVAMEAMACGVPTVLSANTGHLDLIGDERCYTLGHQPPVVDHDGGRITWGESSVDELVEAMERAYTDRTDAARRAERALKFVSTERTWRNFAIEFVNAC